MKRVWLLAMLAVCLGACEPARAQGPIPSNVNPGPANIAGLLYASNFGQWTVTQGNIGQYSWNKGLYCQPFGGGIQFNAFTVGTPVWLIDTQTPAHNELVTPTAVTIVPTTQTQPGSCSITIAPTFGHNQFYFMSSTAGLQESLNWALAQNAVYEDILTPDWTTLGGLTAMIAAAQSSSAITLLDQRLSCWDAYEYSGGTYVSVGTCAGGIGPGFTLTTNGTSGPATLVDSVLNVPDYALGIQVQITPPVAGQYVAVYPSTAVGTCIHGTTCSVASGSGNEAYGLVTAGPHNSVNDIEATVVFGGYSLPVPAANVTAVYAYAGASVVGELTNAAVCNWTGGFGDVYSITSPNPANQTFGTLMTTLTGALVSSVTCTMSVNSSTFTPGTLTSTAVASPLALLVYYTGSPLAASTAINVAPPLTLYDNTLGIFPYTPFPGAWNVPYSVSQLASIFLAMGGPPVGATVDVVDGTTSTDCTTGGGTTYVLCQLNSSGAWVAVGGGGGSSGFPIVLGSTSIAASSTTTAVTGLSVNGVTLTAAGSSTTFLNGAGGYTTPSGSGGINQLTGDGAAGPGSGSQALTLATVNSNVGTFTNANITVNAKGLVTAAANGSGGSSPLTTKGDLYGFSTTNVRVPVGTDGQTLTADSTQADGVAWRTGFAVTPTTDICVMSNSTLLGGSYTGGAGGQTISTIVISGTTATLTITGSISNTYSTGNKIFVSGIPSSATAFFMNNTIYPVASSSGSTVVLTLPSSSGTSTDSVTAFAWYAYQSAAGQLMQLPLFHSANLVGGYDNQTVATFVSNYAAACHPYSQAVTGKPSIFISTNLVADYEASGCPLSTVEAAWTSFLQTVRADGSKIVMLPGPAAAAGGVGCANSISNYQASQLWWYTQNNATDTVAAVGGGWDYFVPADKLLAPYTNLNLFFSDGIDPTESGATILMAGINQALTQKSAVATALGTNAGGNNGADFTFFDTNSAQGDNGSIGTVWLNTGGITGGYGLWQQSTNGGTPIRVFLSENDGNNALSVHNDTSICWDFNPNTGTGAPVQCSASLSLDTSNNNTIDVGNATTRGNVSGNMHMNNMAAASLTTGTCTACTVGNSGSNIPQLSSGLLPPAVLPLATASAFGAVECGSGTTCTAGVISVAATGISQLTGDVTAGPGSGSQAATVVGINGVNLAGLGTGPLYSTAGVPSLETAAESNTLLATLTGCGGTPFAPLFPALGDCGIQVVTTTNIIYASNYGVKADGAQSNDASWPASTANPLITITSNDPPFTPARTGEDCFYVQSNASTGVGTFAYVSALTGNCNGITSTTGASGNGNFIVGANDSAAWAVAQTAYLALPHCGTLVIPAGFSLVNTGFFNVAGANCNAGTSFAGNLGGPTYQGISRTASHIIPEPGFNFSNCTANGCFFSPTPAVDSWFIRDFTISGMGNNCAGLSTSPATSLIGNAGAANGQAEHVFLVDWCGGTTSTGVNGITIGGQGGYMIDVQVDDFGCGSGSGTGACINIIATPGPFMLWNVFGQGQNVTLNISSGQVYDFAGGWDSGGFPSIQVSTNASYYGIGTYIENGGAASTGIKLGLGATATLTNALIPTIGVTPNAAYKAVQFGGANSKLILNCGNSIRGGTSGTGGLVTSSAAGLGEVVDACYNQTLTGITSNFSGTWVGAGSITGTAQTAANIVPGASWGTVSAVSGNTRLEQFTITATAIQASPTITITYPTPFIFTAPICNILQTGGTLGVLSIPAAPTCTITTATVTLAGTSVIGQTYTFQLSSDNL